MILVAGKNKGKRLFRMISEGLNKEGTVELAAVSPGGVERLLNVCAGLGNVFPNVSSDVERREIQLEEGEYRLALVVKLSI